MTPYRIGMILWIPGTILIVLGWSGHVSASTSWLGFIIALVGAVLTWIPPLRRGDPAAQSRAGTALEDIAKLADLRDRGVLTQEEFEQKKAALLRQVGADDPPSPQGA